MHLAAKRRVSFDNCNSDLLSDHCHYGQRYRLESCLRSARWPFTRRQAKHGGILAHNRDQKRDTKMATRQQFHRQRASDANILVYAIPPSVAVSAYGDDEHMDSSCRICGRCCGRLCLVCFFPDTCNSRPQHGRPLGRWFLSHRSCALLRAQHHIPHAPKPFV